MMMITGMDAILHLSGVDERLGSIITAVGSYTIVTGGDPFQSLVRSIMYQQLAGSAADAIHARFLKLYSGRFPSPARLAATPDAQLRAVGLSGRKVEYVKGLAAGVAGGRLDLASLATMEDEQVIEQLTTVRGIGRWTAEMFLIFCLGRPDVLPVGDLGLQRAIQKAYCLHKPPTPERMEKIARPWRPYRSVATWYMWKSLEKFRTIG
ncbi:DNA-3-methyladenine glycosylase family protein [Nitrososphaera viennensis]|uniref:DNA-3-methyladenine glycosylase n=2 Tax=Nitrososphaera viennensis TaxID=1034015 RepID=A0A977IDA0_9ARCH|nr:DNA-3-methyladenine glycosylase [Nitrososphaera viennensis]AIC16787.1 putative DNA-3-methyladenine glycosylase II [Nitrososphaera viennensis EN76]UVS68692.1 DNA-3-methyladenine glycosylase [Nitrososphaera viennensis]